MPSYLYTGRGTKALSLETWEAWKDSLVDTDAADLTTADVCRTVAWVYRCVTLRADALAGVPKSLMRGETAVDDWEEDMWRQVLWRMSASLDLYGATYWLRQPSLLGNALGYQFMLPSTIKPLWENDRELVGFERTVKTAKTLSLDDVLWLWEPIFMRAELGPGIGAAQVALQAAGMGKSVLDVARSTFENGAMGATIISIPGNPDKAETEKVTSWGKRLLGGVKNAGRILGLRSELSVHSLMPPLKDLAMTELQEQARSQIAVAFGVPETMLMTGAQVATRVEEDSLRFYRDTIIPRLENVLLPQLNEREFEPQGLELVDRHQEMSIFQEDEEQRAHSLKAMVDAGVDTVLAMRILGYDLPEGTDWDDLREQADERERQRALRDEAMAQQLQGGDEQRERTEAREQAQREELRQWRRFASKRSGEKAAEFTCHHIDDVTATLIRERLLRATNADQIKAAFDLDAEWGARSDDDNSNGYELAAWEQWAHERTGAEAAKWEPKALPSDLVEVIRHRLILAESPGEVCAAFRGPFLIAAKANRITAGGDTDPLSDAKDSAERRLERLLRERLGDELDEIMRLLGDPPNLDNLDAAFWQSEAGQLLGTIRPEIERLALEAGEALVARAGLGIDWSLVAEEAARWARDHAGLAVTEITDVTRRRVGDAVEQYFREPGRTTGDLRDDLEPWFGRVRAEAIAVTEITAAASHGEQQAADVARRAGYQMRPIWRTNMDELVCPICGEREDKPITDEVYPPLHPRCRCWVTHEVVI